MSSRMRRPETVLLQISRGDWLMVKKHLTAGEKRRMFGRMMTERGERTIDPINVGHAKLLTYLLDWSVTDADDKPVVIRDQTDATIASALDNLDGDDFKEILDAVEAHETAMEQERAEEKKLRSGVSPSSPISTSVSDSQDGPTTTSTTSTLMSTV